MNSPISPGDVVALARGIWRMYKKLVDAPEEMKQLAEKVKLVELLLNHLNTSPGQLDFLTSPDGQEMSDFLQRHLQSLRQTLRQVQDVGRQWQGAKRSIWRRAPFILYTMRAVPGLQAQLEDELKTINSVREWAHQAGVTLGPTALNQIKTIAAETMQKDTAQAGDEFAEVERKRRAACLALKKTAESRRPASLAEQKTNAWNELRQSGLPDGEAQILSELYKKELEKAILESIVSAEDARLKRSVKSVKAGQAGKTIARSQASLSQQSKASKPKDKLKKQATVIGKLVSKDAPKGQSIAKQLALQPKPKDSKVIKKKGTSSGKPTQAGVASWKAGGQQNKAQPGGKIQGKFQKKAALSMTLAESLKVRIGPSVAATNKQDKTAKQKPAEAATPKDATRQGDKHPEDKKQADKEKETKKEPAKAKKQDNKKEAKDPAAKKQDRAKSVIVEDPPSKQGSKPTNAKMQNPDKPVPAANQADQGADGEKKKRRKKKGKKKGLDRLDDNSKEEGKQILTTLAPVAGHSRSAVQLLAGEMKNSDKEEKRKKKDHPLNILTQRWLSTPAFA